MLSGLLWTKKCVLFSYLIWLEVKSFEISSFRTKNSDTSIIVTILLSGYLLFTTKILVFLQKRFAEFCMMGGLKGFTKTLKFVCWIFQRFFFIIFSFWVCGMLKSFHDHNLGVFTKEVCRILHDGWSERIYKDFKICVLNISEVFYHFFILGVRNVEKLKWNHLYMLILRTVLALTLSPYGFWMFHVLIKDLVD